MKTKQEIEKIADSYIDNMDSHSFWDSFISGYETCQKDYEAKVNELLSALEDLERELDFYKSQNSAMSADIDKMQDMIP